MFDLETAIKNWRAELERQKVGGPEVLDELESHLREEFDRLREAKVTDEARFDSCTARIGDITKLKREFRRLRWKRFCNFKEVPPSVKIAAGSFIFRGLDLTLDLLRPTLMHGIYSIPNFILGISLCALPMLIGLGLLRRQNKWRLMAFVCTAFHVLLFAQGLIVIRDMLVTPFTLPSGVTPENVSYVGGLMGFRVSLWVSEIVRFINVAAMAWGCFVLAKPSVRNLFRKPAAA